MHYKNGREARQGDWVVGPTHNSQSRIAIGIVLELMPQQGPCNLKLRTFPFGAWAKKQENPANGDLQPPFFPNFGGRGIFVEGLSPNSSDVNSEYLWSHIDFADAAELFRVDDAERMANAVQSYGMWNSPYFGTEHQ